jgi:hypothetical protein
MMSIVVLQTRFARHLEDRVHRHALSIADRWGDRTALCGEYVGRGPEAYKRVLVPRIPSAAICPDCVKRAREWYAPFHFEQFDCVQRVRLLKALTRDLAAAQRGF